MLPELKFGRWVDGHHCPRRPWTAAPALSSTRGGPFDACAQDRGLAETEEQPPRPVDTPPSTLRPPPAQQLVEPRPASAGARCAGGRPARRLRALLRVNTAPPLYRWRISDCYTLDFRIVDTYKETLSIIIDHAATRKKSADQRKKRAHREERQSGVRAYAAIAEIAVTAGPSSRIILNKFTSKSCASDFYFRVHASDSERARLATVAPTEALLRTLTLCMSTVERATPTLPVFHPRIEHILVSRTSYELLGTVRD
ncbi:hypothetical protein EVAR_99379_1 [Eumeta japonica]|uniref:Uncharacterized protein n=1 Tax=Eumeta variegata TaxID=151549 RepID=A0A4C1YQ65_EUMVA|nr:hypothetical protein EVAR_99379_1 [Eumeta japonica]